MRFLKCISLFCILPLLCFFLGMMVYHGLETYFYPDKEEKMRITKIDESTSGKEAVLTDSNQGETTCDTRYIVLEYDEILKEETEIEEEIPFYFMGLSRSELENAVDEYEMSPSFHDLEKGFQTIDLQSFSSQEITVRKTYKKEEKEAVYYLKVEDNKIVVYLSDMETVFLYTDILLEDMPDELQQEIIHVKCINDLESLYDFLESYSS